MNRHTGYLIPVGFLAASTALSQEVSTRGHYTVKPAMQTKSKVMCVDIDSVKKDHMTTYQVQRKKENASGCHEMVLYDKKSKQKVELRILICPSVQAVEKDVLNFLNSQSVIFTNGSTTGKALGDNVWHFTTKSTGATTIIFTRKNVIVSVFAPDILIAGKLSERIDEDLMLSKNVVEL